MSYAELSGGLTAWGLGGLGAVRRGGFGSGGSLGGAFDPAASAIFAAFTTPPTAARKVLINTCVRALRAGGVWDQLDCLYMLAAADAQASHINWKNPATYTLVPTNAPTFTADQGYAGNGTTSFLASGFNPTTAAGNFTQNSAHMASWGRTASTSSVLGTVNAVLILAGVTSITARINAAAGVVISNSDSTKDILIQRIDASNVEAYRNGVSLGAPSASASQAMVSETFSVVGRGPAGSTTQQIAAASWGGKLTAAQALAHYNALNTYLVGVGAA